MAASTIRASRLGVHVTQLCSFLSGDPVANASAYWLSNTIGSSIRRYYAEAHADQARPEPTTAPTGVAIFAQDLQSVRRFADRDHANIVSWKHHDRGSHFSPPRRRRPAARRHPRVLPSAGLSMATPDQDEAHLRRAIELATEARAAGDMPFGSLLVGPAGDVLAEARNTVATTRDITAHPELKLARWAAERLDPDTARGTTMYTSCQPCPMCTGAIARSGLGRVVFALSGEQLQELRPPGAAAPDDAEVAYEGPALFAEARVPIDGYYQ